MSARENAEAALKHADAWVRPHVSTEASELLDYVSSALEALLDETAPTEWEYALRGDGDTEPYSDCSYDLDWLLDGFGGGGAEGAHIVRRRTAGPWEPIEGSEK